MCSTDTESQREVGEDGREVGTCRQRKREGGREGEGGGRDEEKDSQTETETKQILMA